MAEFLDVIESIDARTSDVSQMFNAKGDGTRVSAVRARNAGNPRYTEALGEARRFLAEITRGTRPAYQLREAMTTSDFPNLFGDIIDRVLLAGYKATPTTYREYMKIGTVPDFRTVKRFTVDGGEAVLSKVAQQAVYPDSKLTDGVYSYSVTKYGRTMPFSWETIVNDDLDALRDTPTRFGVAAARTEEKTATALFASSTGPNSTFFASGHANLLSGAPALDAAGLGKALTALLTQTDTEGEPIVVEQAHLVVPPQLMRTAQNLLTAPEIWMTDTGGTSAQQVHVPNPWRNWVNLHVNYYLPIVDTTKGTTAWYVFADPATSRPAVEFGFLRGHENPEVFMKSPDSVRVGGGLIDPLDGDFATDTITYKIRHVLGGTLLDYRAAVASAGA